MGRDTLNKASYLSFSTFRKTGVEVATPVWFAEEDGVFYIFSASDAGKVKRLRNSPHSRIAACTVTCRVTGGWVETQAEVLSDKADCREALAALRRKYGWQMLMTDFLSTLTGKMKRRAYIRATPVTS